MNPSVAIVVLSWNHLSDTVACLESLSGLDYDNREVILVDNRSEPGVVGFLRQHFPGLTIIALDKNLGFSAGNNVGIQYAHKKRFDYVLLLNNDTVVPADLLSKLVTFAESRDQAGLLGPAVHCLNGRPCVYALGGYIQWRRGLTYNRGSYEPVERFPQPTEAEPVDFVPGCCVLVRRSFIEACGGLDPCYFFNFEDVDWAVRGGQHGFESWLVPSTVIWHRASASLGMLSPANSYYMTRNSLRFFWVNAPKGLRFLIVVRIILRTLRTLAAWNVKPRYRADSYRRRSRVTLLALRDFLLGRLGEMGEDVAEICGAPE